MSQLASSYNRLALLTQTEDRSAAAKYFSQALATLDNLPSAERATPAVRSRRASMLLASGWNLGSAGEFARGIAAIHEARDMMERLGVEDPQNRVYPQARSSIYRDLGVIEDYAGNTADALAAYLTAVPILEQMLRANPENPYFRTTLADVEANAALLSMKLGRRAEGLRLARTALPELKQTALKPDASPAELNLAARFLTQQEFPGLCDARLGLQLAQRGNTGAAGKDYVVLETLGQAYWMNRDRDGAIRSLKEALSLVETSKPGDKPPRVRVLFEKKLAGYRSDPLPDACVAAPSR